MVQSLTRKPSKNIGHVQSLQTVTGMAANSHTSTHQSHGQGQEKGQENQRNTMATGAVGHVTAIGDEVTVCVKSEVVTDRNNFDLW